MNHCAQVPTHASDSGRSVITESNCGIATYVRLAVRAGSGSWKVFVGFMSLIMPEYMTRAFGWRWDHIRKVGVRGESFAKTKYIRTDSGGETRFVRGQQSADRTLGSCFNALRILITCYGYPGWSSIALWHDWCSYLGCQFAAFIQWDFGLRSVEGIP